MPTDPVVIRYDHPDQDELLSSEAQFDVFMASTVWKDMVNFWADRRRIVLADLTNAVNPYEIYRLQGEIKTIDHALGLPQFLKEQLEDEKDAEERKL